MEMLKVALVALSACIISHVLKKEKSDIALLVSLFASILIIMYAFNKLTDIISLLYDLIDKTNVDKKYLEIIIKITGIAYIASFASDICVDADNKMLASKVEFAGKVIIISLAMPILGALIETFTKII